MEKKIIRSSIGMSFAGLGFNLGGSYEVPGKRGTSHLMEHLMCKTFDDLLPLMKRNGIKYNAYTSNHRIVFWFKGHDENMEMLAPILFGRILNPPTVWTKDSFEKEKSTVLEEYADSFNEQTEGVILNKIRECYNFYNPIGHREDIQNFTYEDSIQAIELFKTPAVYSEVSSKDLMPSSFFDGLAEKSSNYVISPEFAPEKYIGYLEESIPKNDKTVVGLMGKSLHSFDDLTLLSMVINCLNSGLESPLYQEIRDKRGLSYFSGGSFFTIAEKAFPLFMACTSNDRADELVEVYQNFFSQDLSTVITVDRFEDCMAAFKIGKRTNDILPHDGAGPLALSEFDPYKHMDVLTYENVIQFSKNLSLDKFSLFTH